MKIVKVPPDVTVKLGEAEKTFTAKEVFTHQLDTYTDVKTLSMVRQAQKVIDAIERGNGTISLEDAEYDLLKGACREIRYIPKVSRHLLPFYEALESAEEVKK